MDAFLCKKKILALSPVPARVVSLDREVFTPYRAEVSLPCACVGQPTPGPRRWFRDGREIGSMAVDEEGALALTGLERVRDSGNYTCFVENAWGTDSVSYRLHVQGERSRSRGLTVFRPVLLWLMKLGGRIG